MKNKMIEFVRLFNIRPENYMYLVTMLLLPVVMLFRDNPQAAVFGFSTFFMIILGNIIMEGDRETISLLNMQVQSLEKLLDSEKSYGKLMYEKQMYTMVELENWRALHPNLVNQLNAEKARLSHEEVLHDLQNLDKAFIPDGVCSGLE